MRKGYGGHAWAAKIKILNGFSDVSTAPRFGTPLNTEPRNFVVEVSALQRISFGILIAFLFMIFSRVFDVQFNYLHIPGVSYRVMGIFLVMSGAFLAAFRDAIGKCLLAFTACFLVAIPFSVWKGGSF